jgi:hypothetical protein
MTMQLNEDEEEALSMLAGKCFQFRFGTSVDQGSIYEAMKAVLVRRLTEIASRTEPDYEP